MKHRYNCRQQRIEQERRDRELALRLAQEDQSQVEELPGRSVDTTVIVAFSNIKSVSKSVSKEHSVIHKCAVVS